MKGTPQDIIDLATLAKLVSGSVDCVLEAQNNVQRSEWDFATNNLLILRRNGSAIRRQASVALSEVRLAKKERLS